VAKKAAAESLNGSTCFAFVRFREFQSFLLWSMNVHHCMTIDQAVVLEKQLKRIANAALHAGTLDSNASLFMCFISRFLSEKWPSSFRSCPHFLFCNKQILYSKR
jgi:hypothetical protein